MRTETERERKWEKKRESDGKLMRLQIKHKLTKSDSLDLRRGHACLDSPANYANSHFLPRPAVDGKTLRRLSSCGNSPSTQTEADVDLDGVKTTRETLWGG